MPMSRNDAELAYDGVIPPGTIVDGTPSRFQANAVRLVKVTPKPEAVLARMVVIMAQYMACGCATEGDLERAGFTPGEIREHRAEAVRLAYFKNPTMLSLEFAA